MSCDSFGFTAAHTQAENLSSVWKAIDISVNPKLRPQLRKLPRAICPLQKVHGGLLVSPVMLRGALHIMHVHVIYIYTYIYMRTYIYMYI